MKRQGPPDRLTRAMDASPQTGKGHGHTELSNELLEAVYRFPFTSAQLRALLFVFRDSYGWKRKETRAYTFTQIEVEIGMARCTAFRAFADLGKLGVIQATKDGGWAPVKNYNAWGATPELPLSIVPLAERSASGTLERSTGANKVSTGATNRSASGTLIGEIKGKKERKGGASAATPRSSGSQTDDTPRIRAKLGDPERPPEEHRDFKSLGFIRRDELTAEWRENVEKAAKKNACRNRCGRPRATEAWPYCRPCTVCHICDAKVDGSTKFMNGAAGITCTTCVEKIK